MCIRDRLRESKLIKLLELLSPEEFKGCSTYVRSPYFTKSKEALRLFDYIRKYHPNFDVPQLEKEIVFKKVFPKQTYSDSKLRNLRSKLLKIIENYLIQLHFEQDDFRKKKLLTKIYGERNYYVEFKRNTTELNKDLVERQDIQNAKYYYDQYDLQTQYYFHQNTPRDGVTKEKLIVAYHNLNYFFAIERLRMGMEFKTREKIFSDNFEFFQSHQLQFLPPENSIIYDLFKKVVDFITAPSEVIYYETKALFLEVSDNLHKDDQQRIVFSLLNFALSQISKQGEMFTREAFNLYQLGLSKSIFISQQNHFPGPTFMNLSLIHI